MGDEHVLYASVSREGKLVLVNAQDLARGAGIDSVTPDILLAAVMGRAKHPAVRIVAGHVATTPTFSFEGGGESLPASQKVGFSDAVGVVIERALEISAEFGRDTADVGRLLISLLEQPTIRLQLGVDLCIMIGARLRHCCTTAEAEARKIDLETCRAHLAQVAGRPSPDIERLPLPDPGDSAQWAVRQRVPEQYAHWRHAEILAAELQLTTAEWAYRLALARPDNR